MTRFRLVGVLFGMMLLLVGSAPAVAAQGSGQDYPIFVHEGTCSKLVEEPLADAGDATLPGNDDQIGGQPGNVLTTSAILDVKFDDLRQNPHAVVVHDSANNFSTIAACGNISGPVNDGKLMIGLYPENGAEIIGVALLEEGLGVPVIGKDKTRITIYLLNSLTPPAVIPTTPTSLGTPAAAVPSLRV